MINIKDYDGDPLSYTTASAPTRGSVSFNSAAGRYTYTPTQAARDAAAQNPGLTDTFTIRATDTIHRIDHHHKHHRHSVTDTGKQSRTGVGREFLLLSQRPGDRHCK